MIKAAPANRTAENWHARITMILAMMGLRAANPALADRLHSAQFAASARVAFPKAIISALAVAGVLIIHNNDVPHWLGVSWACATMLAMAWPCVLYFRNKLTGRSPIGRASILRHAAFVSVQGALWAMPIIHTARSDDACEMASMWTLTTCCMVLVAIGMYPTPLAALCFLLIVGGSGAFMAFSVGSQMLAAIVALFTMFMIVANMRQASAFSWQVDADSQLAEKQATVSLLLREYDETGSDWLWQTDASRRLTGVMPNFARAMQMDAEAIEGRSFLEILAGSAWQRGQFHPALHDLATRLKARQAFSNLILPVEVEHHIRWWELSASPRFDDAGMFLGFRGVGSDVTAQQESAAHIAHLARYDPLTKLPNRLHLTETLGAAVAELDRGNRRAAFLMIDLDRFKAVNDTLGHQIGDRLLAMVGDRLLSICSENEVCGRLGGDEFAVVIRDVTDPIYVNRVAAAIIDRVSRPFEVDHHTLYIGASVGSATAPRDGRTPDTLIRSADLAMYRAKEEGGGRHFAYIPSLHANAEERRSMEIALRHALEKGEMYLVFQPVVDAVTGELSSFEALLRWRHPEFGEVSPAKFIPIAEEARLIGAIGEWVLRTACMEARNWPVHVGIAVNVSAEQLYDPAFASTVMSALAESGIPGTRLELEVTESLFLREGSDAVKILERIMGLGVRIALDDFGTGYSSLGYLARTRFRTIKVDRSFVVGAARGEQGCIAIISAVVALAASLGMSTTAEGVETEEQLATVRNLGCTKIQGYYFGRPMLARDAHQLFVGPGHPRVA